MKKWEKIKCTGDKNNRCLPKPWLQGVDGRNAGGEYVRVGARQVGRSQFVSNATAKDAPCLPLQTPIASHGTVGSCERSVCKRSMLFLCVAFTLGS